MSDSARDLKVEDDWWTIEQVITDAIIGVSPSDGCIIELNQHAIDLFEYACREEAIGTLMAPRCFPNDPLAQEKLSEWTQQAKENGPQTFKLEREDKPPINVLLRVEQIKGRDLILITCPNKPEPCSLHSSSNTNDLEFRMMAETLPLAIYLSSGIDQICEYINPTFTKLFGYTIEDVPTIEEWWHLAYPDDTYRNTVSIDWNNRMVDSLKTHQSLEPMETIVTCKDGSTKTILWGYSRIGEKGYAHGLDITTQKKIAAALEKSDRHLNAAQATAGIGSWEQNGVTNELVWSNTVYELFGLDPQTTTPSVELFFNNVSKEDRKRVEEAFQNSLKPNAPPYEIIHNIIRSDTGESRIVQERCRHLRDTNGNIINSLGTVQDITDLKKTELELEENRKLLSDVINSIPDMLWMKDRQGVFLLCNQQFEKLLMLPKEEIIGKTDYDLFPKEKADSYRKWDKIAIENNETTANEESAEYADGYSTWIETLKTPIFGKHNEPIGVLGIGRDISQRNQALKESKERQKFLDLVVDSSPIPMWIGNPEGTILRANQALYNELNTTPEQVIGKYNLRNDENLYSPEMHGKLDELFIQKKQIKFEISWKATEVKKVDFDNVNNRVINASLYPLLNSDDEIMYIICQWVDVTESKKAVADLARHQLDLENEVAKRTKDLRRIVNAMAGRENRMADLKTIISKLQAQIEKAGLKPIKNEPTEHQILPSSIDGERE